MARAAGTTFIWRIECGCRCPAPLAASVARTVLYPCSSSAACGRDHVCPLDFRHLLAIRVEHPPEIAACLRERVVLPCRAHTEFNARGG